AGGSVTSTPSAPGLQPASASSWSARARAESRAICAAAGDCILRFRQGRPEGKTMAEPVLRFEYPGGDKDDGRGDPGRKHFYLFKTDRAVSEVQIFEKGANNRLHSHLSEDGV